MKKFLFVFLVFTAACTFDITGPTISNTNSNNNTIDIHDLVNFAPVANPTAPVPAPGGGTETPLPLPANAQTVATNYANANILTSANSCPDTGGEAGWKWLDGLVKALQATDPRWGYMVKTTGSISKDVIAYRATSDNLGAWGVDVVVDSCGTSPKFGWQVLGFDPNAQWSGTRF